MNFFTNFFVLGIICIGSASAVAQSISNVHVIAERDSTSNKDCGISSESSITAVKSALRYNRISFVDSSPQKNVTLYINVNNFKVDSLTCSVNASLKIYFVSRALVPGTGKSLLLRSELCSRATSGYLNIREMQKSINSALKEFVDECVISIEEELKTQD